MFSLQDNVLVFYVALDAAEIAKMKESSSPPGGVPVAEVLNLSTASSSTSRKRKVSNCFVNVLFVNIY